MVSSAFLLSQTTIVSTTGWVRFGLLELEVG